MTADEGEIRRPRLAPGTADAALRHALSTGDRAPGDRRTRCLVALRALRDLIAREAHTTPYAVAHDTDLEALVRLAPTTPEAVRHVGILPEATAEAHATAFSRVIDWFAPDDATAPTESTGPPESPGPTGVDEA